MDGENYSSAQRLISYLIDGRGRGHPSAWLETWKSLAKGEYMGVTQMLLGGCEGLIFIEREATVSRRSHSKQTTIGSKSCGDSRSNSYSHRDVESVNALQGIQRAF